MSFHRSLSVKPSVTYTRLPVPKEPHVLWQPRGSMEHGHHLLPVDLMQGVGCEYEGTANRCDRQDVILPEAGE